MRPLAALTGDKMLLSSLKLTTLRSESARLPYGSFDVDDEVDAATKLVSREPACFFSAFVDLFSELPAEFGLVIAIVVEAIGPVVRGETAATAGVLFEAPEVLAFPRHFLPAFELFMTLMIFLLSASLQFLFSFESQL
jgi:hypothetical protein